MNIVTLEDLNVNIPRVFKVDSVNTIYLGSGSCWEVKILTNCNDIVILNFFVQFSRSVYFQVCVPI